MPVREALVVVSPHLDDGVLSSGGCLARAQRLGRRCAVVSVFAGAPKAVPPLARSFHEECGLGDEAIIERRQEDREACELLGAMCLQLEFLEALYRLDERGLPLYAAPGEIFGPTRAEDASMAREVACALRAALTEIGPVRLVAPLGIGRHVDHVIVRQSVEAVCDLSGLSYFEDAPYVMWCQERDDGDRSSRGLSSQIIPLSDDDWNRKITAIEAYRSQVRMLWPTHHRCRTELEDYALSLGGGLPAERLWVGGPGGRQ